MKDLDTVPHGPFDRFAKLSSQTRRTILRLAKRYGRGRRFERAVIAYLRKVEPALASRLQVAQVFTYITAANQVVEQTPRALLPKPATAPPKPPELHEPDLEPDEPSPYRFPQVVIAKHHLDTRIPLTKDEYDELDIDSQRVAFTVARLQTESAVRAVQNALSRDIEQGGALRDFRLAVGDELDASGLSDSQVETIYRTHVGRAYSAGQVAILDSPAVRTAFPYLMYSATHDSRVRPDHLAMESLGLDGTAIYRADDPIWDLYYPPWGWACRCMVIPISITDAAGYGVREAIEWKETGVAPSRPEFVSIPDFPLPKGWVPTGRRLTPV